MDNYGQGVVHTSKHPIFYVTVDIALFTIQDGVFKALAIRRVRDPHGGKLALPGGFVRPDEDLDEAAIRELEEETGVREIHLDLVRTFGAPGRDERGRVVSVAYAAVLPVAVEARAGTDASEAVWLPVDDLLAADLAFDHREILESAVERVRAKLEYTSLALAFVGEEFTLSELRRVYEVIWGQELDPGNFQRKMRHTEAFVVPTDRTRSAVGRGRPAAVFRARRRGLYPLSTPITRAGS